MLDCPGKLVVYDIHADAITGGVVAGEHGAGHRVLDLPLNEPAQRPRAVGLIVTTVQEPVAGRRRQRQLDVALGQPLAQVGQHLVHDCAELRPREAVEDDCFVNPVQELGTEGAPQRVHDPVA